MPHSRVFALKKYNNRSSWSNSCAVRLTYFELHSNYATRHSMQKRSQGSKLKKLIFLLVSHTRVASLHFIYRNHGNYMQKRIWRFSLKYSWRRNNSRATFQFSLAFASVKARFLPHTRVLKKHYLNSNFY